MRNHLLDQVSRDRKVPNMTVRNSPSHIIPTSPDELTLLPEWDNTTILEPSIRFKRTPRKKLRTLCLYYAW